MHPKFLERIHLNYTIWKAKLGPDDAAERLAKLLKNKEDFNDIVKRIKGVR